jgi:hypothetical protein
VLRGAASLRAHRTTSLHAEITEWSLLVIEC